MASVIARSARTGIAASRPLAARSLASSASRQAGSGSSTTPHDRVAAAAHESAHNAVLRGGKTTTGIAGLAVHSRPLPELKLIYQETLEALALLPAGTAYRQAVEALTRHRLEVIERNARSNGGEQSENAIEAVERELELGQIEEVVTIAEGELSLARKFLEWKPWESLVEKPLDGQWQGFTVHPSTTHPET